MSETAPQPDFLLTDLGTVGVLEKIEDPSNGYRRIRGRLGEKYDPESPAVVCDLPQRGFNQRILHLEAEHGLLLFLDLRPDVNTPGGWIAENVVPRRRIDVDFIAEIRDAAKAIAKNREEYLKGRDLEASEAALSKRQEEVEDRERNILQREERIAPREAAAGKAEERIAEATRLHKEAEALLREAKALKADAEWCLPYVPKAVSITTAPTGEALTPDSWRRLAEGFERSGIDADFARSFLLSSFACLRNGRFLLLAGHVGVGKSTLVKRAADLLGGDQRFLPVRPGWLDPTDLLGYLDAQGRFEKGLLTKELGKASDPDRLLYVLLDEMNIARVENYGADLLACLGPDRQQVPLSARDEDEPATTARTRLREAFDELRPAFMEEELDRIERMLAPPAQSGGSKLDLGSNTVFCGTLNVDDSTENLSPKMLDRSFLLRFAKCGATPPTAHAPLPVRLSSLRLLDVKCDGVERWEVFLASLNGLEKYLLPISHRVREDYLLFDALGRLAEVDPKDVDASFAFGRILPRVRFFRHRVDEDRPDRLLEWLDGLPAAGAIGEAREALKHMIASDDSFVNYQNVCG